MIIFKGHADLDKLDLSSNNLRASSLPHIITVLASQTVITELVSVYFVIQIIHLLYSISKGLL